MKYLSILIGLYLSGCALTDSTRDIDGCEQLCYICIGYYNHCGEKDADADFETFGETRAIINESKQ